MSFTCAGRWAMACCTPGGQAALLRPILEGVVGDLRLPDAVRTVAAANPPDIAADGWDLAPPVANRFVHLTWELDADTVRTGFTTGWPAVHVPTVEETTLAPLLEQTRALVGVFLGSKPELLTQMPRSSEEAGRAFPTPRSWEMAARLHAHAQAAGVNSTVVTMLMAGTVGITAAGMFLNYLREIDLPDPETLLADPAPVTLVMGGDEPIESAIDAMSREFLERTREFWITWVRGLAVSYEWQPDVDPCRHFTKAVHVRGTPALSRQRLTTSIPEAPNTPRTWDYRFCWLRDAYFVIRALNRLGATQSMEHYLDYITTIVADAEAPAEASLRHRSQRPRRKNASRRT